MRGGDGGRSKHLGRTGTSEATCKQCMPSRCPQENSQGPQPKSIPGLPRRARHTQRDPCACCMNSVHGTGQSSPFPFQRGYSLCTRRPSPQAFAGSTKHLQGYWQRSKLIASGLFFPALPITLNLLVSSLLGGH